MLVLVFSIIVQYLAVVSVSVGLGARLARASCPSSLPSGSDKLKTVVIVKNKLFR